MTNYMTAIREIEHIVDNAPELNMNNYDEVQVDELNSAMIEICNILGNLAECESQEATNEAKATLTLNSSWDWLMPVIESISKQQFEDGDRCYPRTFGMISEGGQFMFRFNRHQLFSADTLIEAAFNAVIDRLQSGLS
jgi:hypothetical protein